MKVVVPPIKAVRFKDVGEFSHGKSDLTLVDVINDTKQEVFQNDFIDTPGAFVYEIDLAINVARATSMGVESLALEFYMDNPNVRRPIDRSQSRAQRAVGSHDAERSFFNKQKPAFASAVIDLGLNLPDLNFTGENSSQVGFVTQRVLLPTKPTTRGPLSASPIRATPTQTSDPRAAPVIRKEILQNGGDPFNMLSTPKLGIPLLGSQAMRGNSKYDSIPMQDPAPLISSVDIQERRSLIQTWKKLRELDEGDSNDAYALANALAGNANSYSTKTLGYSAILVGSKTRIRRRIELPKRVVGLKNRFFVKMTPIVRTDNLTSTQAYAIPSFFSVGHLKKVDSIFHPRIAPSLIIRSSAPGRIELAVEQIDPTARSIVVTRRIYSPRLSPSLGPATVIQRISTPPGETFHTIVDLGVPNNTLNTVVYRATAIGTTPGHTPTRGLSIKGAE